MLLRRLVAVCYFINLHKKITNTQNNPILILKINHYSIIRVCSLLEYVGNRILAFTILQTLIV